MIALSVIAFFAIGSHFFFVHKIDQVKSTALIINTSGMQRMLSQRIALLAREVAAQNDSPDSQKDVEALRDSLSRLQNNHKKLSSGLINEELPLPLSQELLSLYRGPGQIDALFDEYIFYALQFVDEHHNENSRSTQLQLLADKLVAMALGGILEKLDAAVSQYQHEAEERTQSFLQMHAAFLIVALCILALEAVLIFRPIVNKIVRTTGELEESNSELLEFSYRISHELRAPIVSSQGLMEVAEAGVKDNDRPMIVGALSHAKTSLHKLETLIEDIINLTRMKSASLSPEAVNVSELVAGAIANLSHMTETARLSIRTEIDIPKPILVVRLHLQQIIENLVSNAIKYHDPAVDQPWVRVSAHIREDVLVLRVEDNGLGIPEEQHTQVFGMFQRFHPTASFGSGLGLYLVQKNAHLLGGQIQFLPLDKGTAFELRIPLASEQAAQSE